MSNLQPKPGGRAGVAPLVPLVLRFLGLSFLGLSWAGAAQASGVGDFVVESSRAAKLNNCVEPTEYMRRYHMEVIRHQRDTTVYGGIRSTKHSLAGCVDCHVGYDAQHEPVAINAKRQFCKRCHNYAAVTLNCFDCHATLPEGEGWNQVRLQVHDKRHMDASSQGHRTEHAKATLSGPSTAAAAAPEGRER